MKNKHEIIFVIFSLKQRNLLKTCISGFFSKSCRIFCKTFPFSVIETMAGQGNTIGGKFEELQIIISLVKNKKRVGVCLDTCHIFAAGQFYNIYLDSNSVI